jgi:uncharacterized protein (TIGR03382 family)
VQGCRAEPRTFCPAQEVTRVQFAVMLARAFRVDGQGGCGEPLPVPDAGPPPAPDAAVPPPADAALPDAAGSPVDGATQPPFDGAPPVDGATPVDASPVDGAAPDAAAAHDGAPPARDATAPASSDLGAPDAGAAIPVDDRGGCAACDQAAGPATLPWLALLLLVRLRRRAVRARGGAAA